MAGNEREDMLRVKSTYTFNEAVEYLKMLDRKPTNTNETVSWYSVKTGKRVEIGYNN